MSMWTAWKGLKLAMGPGWGCRCDGQDAEVRKTEVEDIEQEWTGCVSRMVSMSEFAGEILTLWKDFRGLETTFYTYYRCGIIGGGSWSNVKIASGDNLLWS